MRKGPELQKLRPFDLRTAERLAVRFLVHAGMGLTAPGGLAVPGSSAPSSSSCLWSLRERCFGPAHMTTATATAHHTAASSHDCLTESAPEKASGEMKLPET